MKYTCLWTIALTALALLISSACADDPEPTPSAANIISTDTSFATSISPGEPVEGETETSDETDLYSFQAESGQWYRIEMTPGTLDRSVLTLFDRDGLEIASNEVRWNIPWLLPNRIIWLATGAGQHYIELNAPPGYAPGTYMIEATPVDITDDHANHRGGATDITVDQENQAVIDYGDDADFFQFKAEKGVVYHIGVESEISESTQTTLYDSDGIQLKDSPSWPDSGRGFAWKSHRSGVFYVRVAADLNGETGLYTLTVSHTDTSDDYADYVQGATVIKNDTAIEGSLDFFGDVDCFRVQLDAGQFYRIGMELETLSHAELRLYDADGVSLSDADGNWLTGGPWFIWHPTRSGEYYLGMRSVAISTVHNPGPGPFGPPCQWFHQYASEEGGSYKLTVSTLNDIPTIALGETIVESLDHTADADLYRFRGEAGKLYSIHLTLASLRDAWVLLSDAKYGHLNDTFGKSLNSRSLRLDSPARISGDYFITVNSLSGGMGTYRFKVEEADNTDDHANDLEGASPIMPGQTVEGNVEYLGDRDFFRFSAVTGSTYAIEVELGTLRKSQIHLYTPDGFKAKGFDRPSSSPNALRFVWKAPESADYRILVKSGSGPMGMDISWTGSYTLKIYRTRIVDKRVSAPRRLYDDHGNDRVNATPISVGKLVQSEVDYGGDDDFYSFPAEAGQQYVIEMQGHELGAVWVNLTDKDDQTIEFETGSADTGSAEIHWEATESGEYYVSAGATNSKDTGRYVLTVAHLSIADEDKRSAARDDYGSQKASATSIVLGKSIEGTLELKSDWDFFVFQAEEGHMYYWAVTPGTESEFPYAELYSNQGPVGQGTTGMARSRPHRNVWRATVSGKHYVGIWGHSDNPVTYTLIVDHSDITDDYPNATVSAATVRTGEATRGALEYSGDNDYFHFKPESGRTYQIDLTLEESANATLTLYDADDQRIIWDDATNPGNSARIVWSAPGSGVYYIAVNTHDVIHAVPYELTITEQ